MPSPLRERFSLGRRFSPLRSFDPPIMRLDADVRRCVVFLGHASPDGSTFEAAGTAFFLAHENFRYLVTAQHVAAGFGEDPFTVRINNTHGSSYGVHCDPLDDEGGRWISHPDPTVDLAISFWHFKEEDGIDMLAVDSALLLSEEDLARRQINVGDACHAIGLFRLLQGTRRNVPIVHTGHIAMMAGEELIPVKSWRDPTQRELVNCHLVEMQQLKGLSGAPVLVRPSFHGAAAATYTREGSKATLGPPGYFTARDPDVFLLGVWASSWDAPPDEVASAAHGHNQRVAMGLGGVVPASRLIEMLNLPEMHERRAKWLSERRARNEAEASATPDGAA